MKFLKQNSVNLLISLCELIIGILLLIDPTGFSNGIIIAFGAACLAFGIVPGGSLNAFAVPLTLYRKQLVIIVYCVDYQGI